MILPRRPGGEDYLVGWVVPQGVFDREQELRAADLASGLQVILGQGGDGDLEFALGLSFGVARVGGPAVEEAGLGGGDYEDLGVCVAAGLGRAGYFVGGAAVVDRFADREEDAPGPLWSPAASIGSWGFASTARRTIARRSTIATRAANSVPPRKRAAIIGTTIAATISGSREVRIICESDTREAAAALPSMPTRQAGAEMRAGTATEGTAPAPTKPLVATSSGGLRRDPRR